MRLIAQTRSVLTKCKFAQSTPNSSSLLHVKAIFSCRKSQPVFLNTCISKSLFFTNSGVSVKRLFLVDQNWVIMCRLLCSLAGPLCLIGSLLIYLLLPSIVKWRIRSRMAIQPGSDFYPKWLEMPVPMEFRIYIFEVTNPAQVLRGQNPLVKERGPYFF